MTLQYILLTIFSYKKAIFTYDKLKIAKFALKIFDMFSQVILKLVTFLKKTFPAVFMPNEIRGVEFLTM